MASMAMAQAVLEHAHRFYDVENWCVLYEYWDAWAVLEAPRPALDTTSERTILYAKALTLLNNGFPPPQLRINS
jgi:hypothetical protein